MLSCPEIEWIVPVTTPSLLDVHNHKAGLPDLSGSFLVLRASFSCSLANTGPFQLWLSPLGHRPCSLGSSVEIPIPVRLGDGIRA